MKGKRIFTLFACLCVLLVFATQDIRAMDVDVPGPHASIQAAIDLAEATGGGTVRVAAGVYNTTTQTFPIYMKDGVQLIGEGADVCTLDAEGLALMVISCSGISDTARIEGFTIKNANDGHSIYGGGIYLEDSYLIIANNIITGNSAFYGGGINSRNSYPTITNNIITGNVARYNGGGINSYYSSPIIINNIITGNTATGYFGGGISCGGSHPDYPSNFIVVNNIIAGNTAKSGGGIYSDYGSTAAITNNTITGNTANLFGGGIYCYSSSSYFGGLTNNIITKNIASSSGGGIYGSYSLGFSRITFNDVWANVRSDASPSDFYPSVAPNNISENPMFKDLDGGDYHLQFDSPCIDAGDNFAPGLPLYDFEGDTRVVDGNFDGDEDVDLGADEYPAPPLALSDEYTINEDEVLTEDAPGVLGNDSASDADDILIAILVDDVSHGVLTLNADGSFSYMPNEDYNGKDSFTYKANDGEQDSGKATVTITIDAVNDRPQGTDDHYSVDEDGTLTVSAPGVLGNDEDMEGSALSAIPDTGVSHGSLTLNADGSFTYEPAENYYGPDSFIYKAHDGELGSGIIKAFITVNSVNDLPVADDQPVTTYEDTSVDITLTASDVDDTVFSFFVVADPTNGTFSGTAPDLTYKPDLNFYGTDTFTFKVNDGEEDSNVATVIIDIDPVNDPPVAESQSVTTYEDIAVDITLSASDVEEGELTYSVTGPLNGTLSGTAPALTYTPNANFNGLDSFTFQVNDGELDSGEATVGITVKPVNDLPEADAGPDQTVGVNEQCQAEVTLDGTGSSDIDGDPLTYTWEGPFGKVTGPQPIVTLGSETHPITITLTVDDGNGGTATAIVLVTVKDKTPPTILLSDSTCVDVHKLKNANMLTVSASDNCSPEVELVIDKVKILNKRGRQVWGRGIYRVVGNDIYVFPNGRDWSIVVTVTASDSNGNANTESLSKPLLQCNRWSAKMARLIRLLYILMWKWHRCW